MRGYRRAQLQMGESIMVLIIFLFLLVLGVVFYAKIHTFISRQDKTAHQGDLSEQIAQKIRYMPELQCTLDGVVQFDCYDLIKLKAFALTASSYRQYYAATVFGDAHVTITSVFPEEESFTLFGEEYDDASASTSSSTPSSASTSLSLSTSASLPFRMPLLLHDSITGLSSFGYLTIEVYQQ